MSVFTGDDLKRMKDGLKKRGCWYGPPELNALLVRLEAAEKLAKWVHTWEGHTACKKKCALEKNIEAWRKAAGK